MSSRLLDKFPRPLKSTRGYGGPHCQVMLEQGAVEIAGNIPETEKFVKELMGMQVKISAAGNDQYGSWRDGEHDDLVLAAALGCWRAKKYVRWSLFGTQRLPGM